MYHDIVNPLHKWRTITPIRMLETAHRSLHGATGLLDQFRGLPGHILG
jgi:hypothetical protein